MNTNDLPKGAKDKLAAINEEIRSLEVALSDHHAKLKERMYRAGGEQTPEIITLGAAIRLTSDLLVNRKQTLARVLEGIHKLPSNGRLMDVEPPVPTEDQTLESVRAQIATLRKDLRTVSVAQLPVNEMMPRFKEVVNAILEVQPHVTPHGETEWPARTRTPSMELWAAGSREALIKQRAAEYATQVGDGPVLAKRETKKVMINRELDALERLEEVLVCQNPHAMRAQGAPLFAVLQVEQQTTVRRAAA